MIEFKIPKSRIPKFLLPFSHSPILLIQISIKAAEQVVKKGQRISDHSTLPLQTFQHRVKINGKNLQVKVVIHHSGRIIKAFSALSN